MAQSDQRGRQAEKSRKGARWRLSWLKNSEAYQAVPELRGLHWPDGKTFDEMQTFHLQLSAQRQRADDLVESADRRLRFGEKPWYKWRGRKSIVRVFLLRISRHVAKTKPQGQQPPRDGGG